MIGLFPFNEDAELPENSIMDEFEEIDRENDLDILLIDNFDDGEIYDF